MLEHHRLVFVGGLHRSGTTPLARCLAEHPDVSGFAGTGVKEDEGQHLQSVYPSARAYGGAGRFALSPEAHLDETSPLATTKSSTALLEQWAPHWDLSRPVLVEKSPPNLVMTRFLQALFPDARIVVVLRHPVVVALSTVKWSGGSLDMLMANWFTAHERFAADRPHLQHVHVLTYEDLVHDPAGTLAGLADFLDLGSAIPAGSIQGHRSQTYQEQWAELAGSAVPWRRRTYRTLVERYEDRAQQFGYTLHDLDQAHGFPPA